MVRAPTVASRAPAALHCPRGSRLASGPPLLWPGQGGCCSPGSAHWGPAVTFSWPGPLRTPPRWERQGCGTCGCPSAGGIFAAAPRSGRTLVNRRGCWPFGLRALQVTRLPGVFPKPPRPLTSSCTLVFVPGCPCANLVLCF